MDLESLSNYSTRRNHPECSSSAYSHDFLGITLLLPLNALLTNCSALKTMVFKL